MTNSKNNRSVDLSRRKILKAAGAVGLASTTIGGFSLSALATGRITLTMADIGVGDPGDWTQFTRSVGNDVNVVAIGNGPSAIVNQLIAGGGMTTYDIINIVGGMQKPLAQADLIREIDTTRLPNWGRNTYIADYLAKGSPGFDFISHDDRVYGVPTVLQADSFAYLPDETGELDSYSALFDERFRGYVALEDNYTTAVQKTALYMKTSELATIDDPSDMTTSEIDTVINFLIEKKNEGQFRVIWSSFDQAVNLLVSKEVFVMDCWEPMVIAANQQGANVKYAEPREGYLLWAMAAYIINNPSHTEADISAAYELLNFMLGPWYGATITNANGYLTNPQAADFAAANPELFDADTAARIKAIDDNGKAKFQRGGTWQNRWPTNVDYLEEAWQRFKSS